MSLSEKGLLRWYTACCRTAIGNTPRNPKLSYVGLVHSCLAGSPIELDAAFGPAKAAINTASANGTVNSNVMVHVPSVTQDHAKRVGLSPERQVPGQSVLHARNSRAIGRAAGFNGNRAQRTPR